MEAVNLAVGLAVIMKLLAEGRQIVRQVSGYPDRSARKYVDHQPSPPDVRIHDGQRRRRRMGLGRLLKIGK